ncbi:MAG: hypothetical protein AB7P23_05730, partial [Amphiplicatus sp.]
LAWIDYALAALFVVVWAFCGRAILRSRSWARTMLANKFSQRALAFVPHFALVASVVFGIPLVVSRVISWSWIWLWFYLPVGVVVLVSIAMAAALVAGVRLVQIAIFIAAERRA